MRLLVSMTIATVMVCTHAVCAAAQKRDATVRLTVTLDHADWRYHVGDTAVFHVSLLRGGRVIPDARVQIELGPERMPPERSETLSVTRRGRSIEATMIKPGFLRATARAVIDGTAYTQMATAAFDPDKITSSTTMPHDFEAFWSQAIAEARDVPLQPILSRLADRSTPDVDVYHVSFQNQRVGSRLYGMLSVPACPGNYPAILQVPGAGVRPYFPDVATARRGVIHLVIGIHGIPVDRDSLLYNELRATALHKYWLYGVEDRDAYYYKRVYAGVVRAGDFLFTLPKFDKRNYVVRGGSQGGGLAIVAGALDPRVKAIAASHPALADHFAYFEGRAGGWPHFFADTAGMKAKAEKMETLRYYDVVNFARILRVPAFFAFGFNDRTVPPSSVFAAYNVISAPKQTVIVPEGGHANVPAQDALLRDWVLDALGVSGAPRSDGCCAAARASRETRSNCP